MVIFHSFVNVYQRVSYYRYGKQPLVQCHGQIPLPQTHWKEVRKRAGNAEPLEIQAWPSESQRAMCDGSDQHHTGRQTSLPWLCVVSALCWWSFWCLRRYWTKSNSASSLDSTGSTPCGSKPVKRAAQVPLPAALRTRLPCAPCAHFLCSRLAGWKAQAFSAKRCRRSNFASHATWSVATKSAGTSGNGEGQKERKKGPGARRGLERATMRCTSLWCLPQSNPNTRQRKRWSLCVPWFYWGPSDDAQLWPAVCLKKVGVRPIYGLSMPLLIGEHFDKLPDPVVTDISRQRHEDANMVLY